MFSKSNRPTTCAFRAKAVLGWIGAIVIPLSIFSDPLHPLIAPPVLHKTHPEIATASQAEEVSRTESHSSYIDLEVDFRDGAIEFGSHIPTDNGAAKYDRQMRAPYEYSSFSTKGGSKVSLRPSDAKVLTHFHSSDQDQPIQSVKVMFSVTK